MNVGFYAFTPYNDPLSGSESGMTKENVKEFVKNTKQAQEERLMARVNNKNELVSIIQKQKRAMIAAKEMSDEKLMAIQSVLEDCLRRGASLSEFKALINKLGINLPSQTSC
ncbi:MAG TPA: hypothetical protein PLM07_21685 [Candidatus Rifleibacterium sp.]|nr:hypothetical protein [Candidatus Rifleibacterium sp.]